MDIALDKVTEIILRLRAVEVKEGVTDPDSGSNPTDDGSIDILTSGTDDATEQEIRSMIAGLNEDERADLERSSTSAAAITRRRSGRRRSASPRSARPPATR